MRIELTELLWLDQQRDFSLVDIVELSGLPEAELRALVECGVLAPADPTAAEWRFGADCLLAARAACRLREDFELDSQGLAVALTLMERIHDLERQLGELRARSPRRMG